MVQFDRRESSPGLPNWAISPYGPHQAIEIFAVQSFATHVGRDLAGSFSDDIWCDILPRVAQYETSIWHAVVAVGLLDNSIRLGYRLDDDNPNISAAITHYTQSIKALNEQLAPNVSSQCKDVVLLSCVIFAVFECLQNHYQSALRHITGGTKLLMEWENEVLLEDQASNGTYLNHRSLKPLFLSLDSQAVQLGAVDFRDHYILPAMYSDFDASAPFKTIHEAHIALNSIFNRLSRWAGCNEFATSGGDILTDDYLYSTEQTLLHMQLAAWETAFEPLRRLPSQDPAIHLLIVQKKIMQIFFEKGLVGPSEMAWDENLVAFEEATEYAETYMDLVMSDWRTRSADPEAQSEAAPTKRPIFTMAMGIVPSLYMVSAKCRVSSVRKRALRMLKVCGRKEGIWDSSGCAAVAERIIKLEEENALPDGQVPESARIYMLDIHFGEDGSGQIVYKKLLPKSDGSGYDEEVVTLHVL